MGDTGAGSSARPEQDAVQHSAEGSNPSPHANSLEYFITLTSADGLKKSFRCNSSKFPGYAYETVLLLNHCGGRSPLPLSPVSMSRKRLYVFDGQRNEGPRVDWMYREALEPA